MNATFASVRPVHVSDTDSLAALYIARLLQKQIIPIRVFNDSLYTEEIRALVGISPSEGNIPKVKVLQLLKAQLPQLGTMTEKRTPRLQRNIRMLGRLLSLTDIEEAILTYFVLMDHHPVLADLLSSVVIMDKDALVRFISVALSIEGEIINAFVQSSSTLFATGLLAQELRPERIGVNIRIPRGIKDALLGEADSIESLMKVVLEPSPKPTLRTHDFEHLDSETELLHTYLAEGLRQGVTGINVLIYGPPGTGKTEYARWLASSIKTSLYQVRACNDSEDSISGSDRLSYFRLSQRFLQCSTALILFDEIEDVFPDPDMVSPSSLAAQKWPGKLFINRLLETNPVPTIWIANEISHIDKAYLRRFDYSIELAIPPIHVRRRIAKRHLQKHRLPPTFLEHLAQQDELSAAQISKLAKVLHVVSSDDKTARHDIAEQVIERSMSLLSQKRRQARTGADTYSLEFLNTSHDVSALIPALRSHQTSCRGAMCLYGPPGTGKTVLAHHLASELGMPIHAKRASDILSPYVGETEARIAKMFAQATNTGALLLLDEADSFLSARQGAKQHWDVTAVNELLVQMEQFDGLFICSTNAMTSIDSAAMRRFVLKIKFDYLKPEQRWRLFLRYIPQKLGVSESTRFRSVLDTLTTLTPGDFTTVCRRATLFGKKQLSPDELLNGLIEECKLKRGSGAQAIGFVPSY